MNFLTLLQFAELRELYKMHINKSMP